MSRWVVLLAVVVVAAGPDPALADDIPIIKLDASGPSQEVPADRSFYLSGNADKATAGQAYVVRTGSPTLWGERVWKHDEPPQCAALFAELGKAGFKHDPWVPYDPGSFAAEEIWKTTRDAQVKVSSAWAKEGDTTTFKVLVQHDADFFQPGYRYCIATYLSTSKETEDQTIGDALKAAADPTICRTQADAAENQCKTNGGDVATCRDKRAAEATSCKSQQLKSVEVEIAKLPADQQDRARTDVANAYGAAVHVATAPSSVEAIVKHWDGAVTARPPRPYHLAVKISRKGKPDLADDDLGRSTVALLVLHGRAIPHIDPDNLGTVRTMLTDGSMEIRGVRFLADGSIVAFHDPSAKDAKPLNVKTKDLSIPGTGLTLADVLEFSSGALPFDKEWLPPSVFESRLADTLQGTRQELKPSDAQLGQLRRVAERLAQVAEGIRALNRSSTAVAPAGTPEAVRRDLGRWLARSIQVPCAPAQLVKWQLDAARCPAGGSDWPGYADARSPLVELSDALTRWADEYPRWLQLRPVVVTRGVKVTQQAAALSIKLDVELETWFWSYVSPVVGYSMSFDSRDRFAVRYYGLQVHHKPNPLHESIFTAGTAGFALELALAPTTGTFDDDERFRGLFGIGAVHVGGVVHLVPYTSLSVGGIFMEKRSSTVAEEKFHRFGGLYVGLSVNLNIPAMVKGKFATTKATQE